MSTHTRATFADAGSGSGGYRQRLTRWHILFPNSRLIVGPILLLLLWEVASLSGVLSARTLAAPHTVFATGIELLLSGDLWEGLKVSARRALLGLAIGTVLATVLAIAVGLSRPTETLLDGPMQMLRTVPVTSLVPLFIIWFGIGEFSKVAMVALATVFPIYLNVLGGVRAVEPRLLEAAKIYGLRKWGLVRHVVFPSVLPSFFVGLRYAFGVSWVILVISEQINSDAGLGFLMMDAQQYLRTDIILVCIFVYSILGLLSDMLVRSAEAHFLEWRPSLEGGR